MWLVLALGQQSTNCSFKFWALPTAHTALLIVLCGKTAPLFSLHPACLLYAGALPTVFNALPLNISTIFNVLPLNINIVFNALPLNINVPSFMTS